MDSLYSRDARAAGTGAPTAIEGRTLHWEDAMMSVDDVLFLAERRGDPSLVEKGYVRTNVANPAGAKLNLEAY